MQCTVYCVQSIAWIWLKEPNISGHFCGKCGISSLRACALVSTALVPTALYCTALHCTHKGPPSPPVPAKPNILYTQLFQPLGEKLGYYNGKWFSSHHFGFKSYRKLKF